MSIMKVYRYVKLISVALMLGLTSLGMVNAQQNDEFVEQVLDTAEQKSGFLQVYTRTSRKPLMQLDANAQYRVVEKGDRWTIIRFRQPTIPVWVSHRFANVQAGVADVTVDNLNIRTQPSTSDSIVLGQVGKGYRSQVITSNEEFVQIYAPTSMEFSIRSIALEKTSKAKPVAVSATPAVSTVPAQTAEQTEPKSKQLQVYLRDSFKPVLQVPFATEFRVLEQDADWTIIRFRQPVVTAWVSTRFAVVQAGVADITVDNLNLRSSASLSDSIVIGKVSKGYRSQVVSSTTDFVQIYAPSSMEFAIRTADEEARQSKSDWSLPARAITTQSESEESKKKTPQLKSKIVPLSNKANEQEHSQAPG